MVRDPETPEEWQYAVTAAHVLVMIDSAKKYGLVRGGPVINVDRCEWLLMEGRALGYEPREDDETIRAVLAEFSS